MSKKESFDVALLDKDFVVPSTPAPQVGANIVKKPVITGEVIILASLCAFLAGLLLT